MDSRITTNDPATMTSQGIVYRKNKGQYEVHANGRMVTCTLSARLWKELNRGKSASHDPIAVGDAVHFTHSAVGNGSITALLPRQTKFSRQSAVSMPSAYAAEQVIVANIDQVVPVFAAANPAPRWNMLDRYLVTAESLDLPALILITKIDLARDASGALEREADENIEEYRRLGYPVLTFSAVTGEGLEEARQALRGRTSVLLGKSGVGKTTLLNAIQPGLGLRVGEISRATGKGKHTTTALEMFPLDFGGAIVDTPGVREFGLWDVDEDDLALFFPEMRPLVGKCRFGLDCQHDEEPGCAIRKAVVGGQISPRRYQSYLRIKQGD